MADPDAASPDDGTTASPPGMPSAAGRESVTVKVWDPWIRLFHWSLAIAVIFQLISGRYGVGFFDWHRPIGEVVLALVVFRLVWSVAGSSNAGLLQLVVSPRKALHHLRQLTRRRASAEGGHNAAGGWSVLALLTMLAVQATTGLFIADRDEFVEGPYYGAASEATTRFLYSVHETNAELLTILVIVHVVIVFVYLFYARLNLIMPMLSGRMTLQVDDSIDRPRLRSWWVGIPIAAAVALLVGWLVGWS